MRQLPASDLILLDPYILGQLKKLQEGQIFILILSLMYESIPAWSWPRQVIES